MFTDTQEKKSHSTLKGILQRSPDKFTNAQIMENNFKHKENECTDTLSSVLKSIR